MSMQEAVRQAAQKAQEEQHRRAIESITAVYSSMYSSAATYVNVIMGGGYAGAFAVWTLVGSSLSNEQRSWSGLWLLISLTVFVIWEVAKMILLSGSAVLLLRLTKAKPEQLTKRIDEHNAQQAKIVARLNIFWAIFVLPVTIFTGLAGGAVLIHAFITNLF